MPCPDKQSETGAQFLPSRCARALSRSRYREIADR
jgi:hypothetical protein